MITRRQLIQSSAASVLMPAISSPMAGAQGTSVHAWPTRFVKLVVPFTPGGGIDGIGRIVGARLSEMWGQQVVVENKPGAGGQYRLGVRRALGAGRLHHVHHGGRIGGQSLSLRLDQLRSGCRFRAGHADLSLSQSVGGAELLLLPLRWRSAFGGQKNPGKVTFASPGHGSSPHMSGELFKYIAQVDLTHVPYRGAAPAFTDVIAGRVDCTFAVMASGLPLAQSGQLRALGVTTGHPCPDGAGGAHHRRGRRSRLRHIVLVRVFRAGEDAVRDRAQDARRHRRRARRAGDQGQARPTRRDGGRIRRPKSSAHISRPRWRSGRPSSRQPTSRSTNDHPPSGH